MSGDKHPKTRVPSDADLEGNPGIGSSKGMTAGGGGDPEEIEADSTFEGDVMNEADQGGSVDPKRTGRTNK